MLSSMRQMRLVQSGIESPVAKAAMSGAMGTSRLPYLPPHVAPKYPSRSLRRWELIVGLQRADMRTVVGFGIGAFFSLMSASFAIEDPFRAPQFAGMSTQNKAKQVFKDMGKGMWKSGSGFAKVGALYAGTECVIEGVSSIPLHALLDARVWRKKTCADCPLDIAVSSQERYLELRVRRCHLGSSARSQLGAASDDYGRSWFRSLLRGHRYVHSMGLEG